MKFLAPGFGPHPGLAVMGLWGNEPRGGRSLSVSLILPFK